MTQDNRNPKDLNSAIDALRAGSWPYPRSFALRAQAPGFSVQAARGAGLNDADHLGPLRLVVGLVPDRVLQGPRRTNGQLFGNGKTNLKGAWLDVDRVLVPLDAEGAP